MLSNGLPSTLFIHSLSLEDILGNFGGTPSNFTISSETSQTLLDEQQCNLMLELAPKG